MLTAITLKSFRSYGEARLPLAPLTVLIGANASGKSNAIEALRLWSWLAGGQKLSTIQHGSRSGHALVRGQIRDLVLHGGEHFTLGCESDLNEWNRLELTIERRTDGLHIVHEALTTPGATVPLYVLDEPAGQRGSDAGVAYNTFARGGKKPHVTCSDQSAIFTQLASPAAFEPEHKKARATIPVIVRQYERWLASMLFLDPVPARMRDYAFPSDQTLKGDGGNLSAVLFDLWGADAVAEAEPRLTHRREILRFIQSLPEQDIAGLSFLREPRGGVMVQLTETFGRVSRDYDASLLSDGTLRVLSVAAAMLSAPEGSLVVIEELDNGVHPSRARHLLEQIRAVAERRHLRVLLSTHNPALLDALPDASLGDVVFCYRTPGDGTSQLVRLDDLPDYPELMAQGPLGHLSTTGLLERFVKTRPSADERKDRARAWLAAQRAGTAA